jgi:hypothetical protein
MYVNTKKKESFYVFFSPSLGSFFFLVLFHSFIILRRVSRIVLVLEARNIKPSSIHILREIEHAAPLEIGKATCWMCSGFNLGERLKLITHSSAQSHQRKNKTKTRWINLEELSFRSSIASQGFLGLWHFSFASNLCKNQVLSVFDSRTETEN